MNLDSQLTTRIFLSLVVIGFVGCEIKPKLAPPVRVAMQEQEEKKAATSQSEEMIPETSTPILDERLGPDEQPQSPPKSLPTTLDTDPDSMPSTRDKQESPIESDVDPKQSSDDPNVDTPVSDEEQTIEIPSTWKRLGQHEIWIDFKSKLVILGGNICLTAGQLEMFACPAGTKEHESVIAVNAAASEMHAALVALGIEPGKPCQWNPEYKPASGPVIDIEIRWRDSKSQTTISRSAKQMIQDFHTKKPMTHEWVFGGSELWEDPESGENIYYANSGEMICLSNFSTASLDLNVESSQSNEGLLFQAFTENIPPLGTKVYLVLKLGQPITTPPADAAKNETP